MFEIDPPAREPEAGVPPSAASRDSNATMVPSSDMAGFRLSAVPGVPVEDTLAMVIWPVFMFMTKICWTPAAPFGLDTRLVALD